MASLLNYIVHKIIDSLTMSFLMGWEMFWTLVLGFAISAIVQNINFQTKIKQWFAHTNLKSLTLAGLCGMTSSSCSFAAAAISRSLIKQGANFTNAMAFQFASTNLVIELGIVLALLLGWQFTAAQFIGGIILIAYMALFFSVFLPKNLAAEASAYVGVEDSKIQDSSTKPGISYYFFMDWSSLWKDILLGLVISGILSAFIPDIFWTNFLCKNNSTLAHIIDPLLGPLIAILSFVCSIGNVPLAAVLWAHGMTFGGVLSFLFADLLVLQLLNIYKKYYGTKMATFIAISFYFCMVAAAYTCEWLFNILGLVPQPMISIAMMPNEHHSMHHTGITFNYTAVLNIIAIIFTALLFNNFRQKSQPISTHHHCH